MKVSLKKETEGIPVTEMKDGDLAVILHWNDVKERVGKVVQRYGDHLIIIGMENWTGWRNLYGSVKKDFDYNNCYVRLLEDGDELVIRK